MRKTPALLIALFATVASAQSTVNQGQGNTTVTPWPVQGSNKAGTIPLGFSIAALTIGKTTEVCVTNAAGGTTVPAAALASRRAIELQNLGANAIFCTVDGQAPLSTGALGRRILPGDSWSLDIGPLIIVKCIAVTAAQVTPACTQTTELR